MGVATYRATKDMPERLRNALPDIEELKKKAVDGIIKIYKVHKTFFSYIIVSWMVFLWDSKFLILKIIVMFL